MRGEYREGASLSECERIGVDNKTAASYLDLLVDLLLVRRLEPWHNNAGKRLIKSPRIYVRDSGLVHTLLGLSAAVDVLGHPVGFQSQVVERQAARFLRQADPLPGGARAYVKPFVKRNKIGSIPARRTLSFAAAEIGDRHGDRDIDPAYADLARAEYACSVGFSIGEWASTADRVIIAQADP